MSNTRQINTAKLLMKIRLSIKSILPTTKKKTSISALTTKSLPSDAGEKTKTAPTHLYTAVQFAIPVATSAPVPKAPKAEKSRPMTI